MNALESMQQWINDLSIPVLTVVGVMAVFGLFFGKLSRSAKLPLVIGYMIIGVALGPSLLGLLNEQTTTHISFLTDIALGFVALSIGIELNLRSLRSLGSSIVVMILIESLLAAALVTSALYLVTGDLPLSILFGALAPASAPAGTVAVIHEYKAKGSLTRALYAVVGFDDGFAIIIFGFAAAMARAIVTGNNGGSGFVTMVLLPLKEIGLGLAVGIIVALIIGFLGRLLKHEKDHFILIFGFVMLVIGICEALEISIIFTLLIVGIGVVNTQPEKLTRNIRNQLSEVMPLLFVLFFVLAGANLHIRALPSLGLIGIVYIVARASGLYGGAWLGAVIGRAEKKIRNYLGLGILSQAGVAIGLALIVKQEFGPLGEWGAHAGSVIITTITATSIVFEIAGPLLAKLGLQKAGEIATAKGRRRDWKPGDGKASRSGRRS